MALLSPPGHLPTKKKALVTFKSTRFNRMHPNVLAKWQEYKLQIVKCHFHKYPEKDMQLYDYGYHGHTTESYGVIVRHGAGHLVDKIGRFYTGFWVNDNLDYGWVIDEHGNIYHGTNFGRKMDKDGNF